MVLQDILHEPVDGFFGAFVSVSRVFPFPKFAKVKRKIFLLQGSTFQKVHKSKETSTA